MCTTVQEYPILVNFVTKTSRLMLMGKKYMSVAQMSDTVQKYPILVSHFVKCHVWGIFFYSVVFRFLYQSVCAFFFYFHRSSPKPKPVPAPLALHEDHNPIIWDSVNYIGIFPSGRTATLLLLIACSRRLNLTPKAAKDFNIRSHFQ